MEWQFERVAGPFNFTEGPVWDGRHVFFTDIPSSRTMRYDPQSGECVVHIPQTYEGNGQTLDHDGRLLQVQHKGRAAVRYEPDGTVTTLDTQLLTPSGEPGAFDQFRVQQAQLVPRASVSPVSVEARLYYFGSLLPHDPGYESAAVRSGVDWRTLRFGPEAP